MEAVRPRHLSERPWVSLGKEAREPVRAVGTPGAAWSSRAGRRLCPPPPPHPRAHLPTATATRPRPVSGLRCCLVHRPSPAGK